MPGNYDDIPMAPDPVIDQVMPRESGGRNLPPTANYAYPRSHASGLVQFQPRTWQDTARATGLGANHAEAYQATPDEQIANAKYLEKKYGLNSPYTWAASAPPGGYKAAKGGAYDDIPMQKAKGAYDDIPMQSKGQPWRVPAANEGPRAGPFAASPPTQGPPQRPQGAVDPSIAARRQTPEAPPALIVQAAEAQAKAMQTAPGAGVARWLGLQAAKGAKWISAQSPDLLSDAISNATEWTQEKVQGAAEGAFRKMGVSNPEYQARQLTDFLFNAPMAVIGTGIKSPAIKTADGRVVEGPSHDAIADAGTKGEPGFVTQKGEFVDRTEGAKVAKAARQTAPDTESLHSQDLRPQSAGAMATDKAILDAAKVVPPAPTKAFIKTSDDSFFRVRGGGLADMSEFNNFVKMLPSEFKDLGLEERFYKHMEGDEKLSDPEQALYDRYVKPLKNEEQDLYGEIKKISPSMAEELAPDYVHRMRKGKSREFDAYMGQGTTADPIQGYRRRTTSSLKDRVYHVIENEAGQRKVVAVTDHGTMVLNKGQPAVPLPRYQGAATALGDKFTINGEKWTVKQAKTSEIEAHTNVQYHKNALANTIKNVVQLRAVARSLAEIKRLKATPEWEAYTRPLDQRPDGWKSVDFPPFRDRWFEPHFADLLNDAWSAQKPLLERIAAINRVSMMSLFWSPIPHILNAGTHWATARGWDWINPKSMAHFPMDTAKAVREVVTQGPDYQRALREGSGMVYGSVANEQFYRMLLKNLGESVKREPWKWDPIARVIGVGPSDLARMLYGASSRTLWAVSDVMMMQRLYELQRKGMNIRDAIEDAERHMPNYRIPPQVLGSRLFALVLKDPTLTVFSRYHYGMFKGFAHLVTDLFGPPSKNALGESRRLQSVGNAFALAVLAAYIWPQINKWVQNRTGDKDIELGPKGALTIPYSLWDVFHGKPAEQVIQNAITFAPIPRLALEQLFNLDFFFKWPIREQADQEQGRIGRLAAQTGEHLAQGLNAPYGVAAQAAQKGGLAGAAVGLAKQGLGLRKIPKPYHGRHWGGGTAQEQANYRHAHPRGPIEQLEKRAEQWLKQ